MKHSITFTLTDQQEAGWADKLAQTNALYASRNMPTFADVDDLMVNGEGGLTQLGDEYFAQVRARKASDEQPFLDKLTEKMLADPAVKDRIAQAEGIDLAAVASAEILPK